MGFLFAVGLESLHQCKCVCAFVCRVRTHAVMSTERASLKMRVYVICVPIHVFIALSALCVCVRIFVALTAHIKCSVYECEFSVLNMGLHRRRLGPHVEHL